jgi:Phosphodiester glycosidase
MRHTARRFGWVTFATLLVSACSSPATLGPVAASQSRTVTAAGAAAGSSAARSPTEVGRLTPPVVPGVIWTAAGTVVRGAPATYVARVAGGTVGLMWIDPAAVSFRLVPGYKVPEGSPATAADRRPSTWVPLLVAAFNGGFMLKDGVGGYYYDHKTVRPLRPGLGAFEISSDGRLAVGAWGRDLTLTPSTVAVRENLPLLVDDFRPQTAVTDTAATWGLANGGLWTANRSALGERADGSLVFAYGHEVRPVDMANAMVLVGARRAMVLDMNKSWPGGFVYWRAGGHLEGQRVQPQEYHQPSVYFARFSKDFVAVLRR